MNVHAAIHAEFDMSDFGQDSQRVELYRELDRRAREIEALWKSTWSELADICHTMQTNQLWREGGYESFTDWINSACPCSRSTVYLSMGLREQLRDIPDEEIRSIPLGNARTLAETPRNRRNGHLIEQAKRQSPRQFLSTVIEAVPEAHLEARIKHTFHLVRSASLKLQDGFAMWRLLNDDPEAPVEAVLEAIVAEYVETHEDLYAEQLSGKHPETN